MEWKTRVSELFGCRYPILEGAFGSFGKWELAAAISETGALGLITAQTYRTPARLREGIKKCKDATDKPFVVNVSVVDPHVVEYLKVCSEEGVPIVETAGYKPDALVPRIKESGMKWIHKSARVKDAIHAEEVGADAVIVVGLEGAGFKSPEQLPTLITTIWAKREIKVPFIAAGGIGDARGFLGALGMGADGIMMATAFMATKECPIGNRVKEGLVQLRADNLAHRHRVLASADPQAYAEVLKLRGTMPMNEWLRKLEDIRPKPLPGSETKGRGAMRDIMRGSLAVHFIDSVPTVKELIDSIIREAEELVRSYSFLKAR